MKSELPGAKVLRRIVGSQLSAVVFVQDYLQLQFDGPTLTLLSPVTIRSASGETVADHATGWRDALCAQITGIVRAVRLDDIELVVEFEGGSAIAASIRPEDYRGPEAVQFRDAETIIVI